MCHLNDKAILSRHAVAKLNIVYIALETSIQLMLRHAIFNIISGNSNRSSEDMNDATI